MCDMTEEERLFAEAVREKMTKYGAIATSETTDPRATLAINGALRHIQMLIKGYEARAANRKQVRALIILKIQILKAWKPRAIGDGMTPLPNLDDVRPSRIWRELRVIDGQYHVMPSGRGLTGQQGEIGALAEGGYCFVILVAKPDRILVGTRITGGHTTMSQGADVYFAGEIFFEGGALMGWDNESGHYKPRSEFARQVGHLLPLDKYTQRYG